MHQVYSIIQRAHHLFNQFSAALAGFCGIILFLFMLLVNANIAGRYFFNSPIAGTLEIGQMVLATVILLCLAYAQTRDSHIRVTVLLNLFSRKSRNRIEIAIFAVGVLMMILMAVKSLPFAMASYAINETDVSVDVPVWPTKFIYFFGWTLLGIKFFFEFLTRILPDKSSKEKNMQYPEDFEVNK